MTKKTHRAVILTLVLIVLGSLVLNLMGTWRSLNREASQDHQASLIGLSTPPVRTGISSPTPADSKMSLEAVQGGGDSSQGDSSTGGETTAVSRKSEAPVPQPEVPVVFENAEKLSNSAPDFQHDVQEIASNFTASVETSGVSPYSPEYRKVWKKARQDADENFRALYGDETYKAMQMPQ